MEKPNPIKAARIMAGKTQQEMADHLRIARTTYIRFEQHPEIMTIGTAKKVADFLKAPYEIFFVEI